MKVFIKHVTFPSFAYIYYKKVYLCKKYETKRV